MDYRKIDKDNNMVKVTIKRTDDSTEEKKWVCKRIDDDPDSAKTVSAADKSLPAEDKNLNDESEYPDSWYDTIPSYLEIEMKEGENQEPSRRNSTVNNANISTTHCPVSNREAVDSPGTSCNDPMDLSTSHSKLVSQRDVTNVSYKSPPEAHGSKSKFLGNAYGEGRNVPSLTGVDKIIKGEAAYYLPKTIWTQNTPPMAIQGQMNSGEALAMPTIGIPFIGYNFPMNHHGVFPVSSGFINTEKPEITTQGNIPHHLEQDAQSHLKTNYRHLGTDSAIHGHCSNEPRSNENRSSSLSLKTEGNVTLNTLRNVFVERICDNFVNNLPQHTNNLKRPSEKCVQMDSGDASKSVCSQKKKKSHEGVPDITNYCNVCDRKFKSAKSYNKHRACRQHLKNMNKVGSQQSNSYNFQPNSEGRPLGPTNLRAQLPPHALHALNNNMLYHLHQARAMTPENIYGSQGIFFPPNPQLENSMMANPKYLENKASQSSRAHKDISSKEKINDTNVQISGLEASKTDYNERSLVPIRSQNYFGTESYPHNPRHMNLPVNHTIIPQGIFLPPNPQSENSMMVNPKYLGNKASQSSQAHKDTLVQPEGLTVANSFQKSGDVTSATHHQEDSFRIYHCMVCAIFKTDFLEELEMHINADRSRTPLELVIPTVQGLVCQLCSFKSLISAEMAQHCTSTSHLNRVSHYNHVREGGIHRTKNIFVDTPRSVWVFCNACEYTIDSMVVLKAHAASRNHQYTVSSCKYIESISIEVEYCFCRPCNLKTLTKRELFIHARSKEHRKAVAALLENSPDDINFHDPRNLFYIKERSEPRVSEQNEGSTFVGSEEPHLRKEKSEKLNIAENLSTVNLGSASSTSQQPLPVPCSLCQQLFPEISALVEHVQRIHGVNEAGVKFIVSTISNYKLKRDEEKSLPEKELTDTKAGKVKSITFQSEKSSVANEKLPIKRKSNESSSYQSSVATGQNEESVSSGYSRAIRSGQNVATDENLNQETRTSNTSSSQQFNETEDMRNAGKLDQNPRLNPHGRTCINPSSSQEFYETEGMQNPDLQKERRIHIDSNSRQQFCKTENKLPVEERNVPNSEERLNSNSPRDKITVENDSEPNEGSKYEIEMDDSSSDEFSSTETGSLISNSVLNTSIESNDSDSSDDISVPYERYTVKEKPISSAGRSMAIDSSANQHDALDSQNTRSSLEYQPNLKLRRNVGNSSSTKKLMASVEPKRKANCSNNVSVKIENTGDPENDRMELNDRPDETEAQNSPAATDLQIQAMKNIENIEISGVFSLRGHIDVSSNTDEDEETSDFDIYSDI